MRFHLDCGADVVLDELIQWKTYAGLLMGVPYEEMNARQMEAAKDVACRKLFLDSPVHLIKPKITIKTRKHENGIEESYPSLPAITCVAVLDGPPVTSHGDGAFLTIIWCQDHWASPIDSEPLREICALSWAALAKDYNI